MKRFTILTASMGVLAIVIVGCSSDSGDGSTDSASTATVVPAATSASAAPPTSAAIADQDPQEVIPEGAEVDRKTAVLLGIDIHRTRWGTRPSGNYKFGFEWNVGEFAYQRANVVVWVIQNEIERVEWSTTAVKTDGTEPPGFVVPDKPNVDDYYNIDGLFNLISDAVEAGPGAVSLAFDSDFGYPTLSEILFAPGSDHEPLSFFATQLVPIPGPPEEFGITGDTSPGVK